MRRNNGRRPYGSAGSHFHHRSSGRPTVTGGCMFCESLEADESQHSRKECPLFRRLKGATTRSPYIAVSFRACRER